MKSIYIETTIPSLATAKPSRDTITAGRQASTMLFWERERHKYNLYISQYVLDECSLGDKEAAQRRLEFLNSIFVITKSQQITELAKIYQDLLNIPERSKIDSFHLATCVIAEIDYMLSWNCVHLGIKTFSKLKEYNEKRALLTPLLITPEALIDTEEVKNEKF